MHGTTLEAFWTNIVFILAVVISQPLYTTTSDVLGRKLPLYAAFGLFLLGSVVFAVAPTMPVLIGGRVLQGLGGGGLDVLGEIILADITTLKERPLYIGLYALPMAGGAVCGPVIGAAFAAYVDWRWIGWINLPIVAVGLILSFFFLNLRPLEASFGSKLRRLDWVGMLLFTIGSTAIALPLSWAGSLYSWSSWRTLLPLILGLIALVILAVYEAYPQQPMFPHRLFRRRSTVAVLVAATVHGACFYSIIQYSPLFFQSVIQQTPFRAAISVLPACVCVVAFSILGVLAIEFARRYRLIVFVNSVLVSVGLGLWALWRHDSSPALLYGTQVVPCIGLGVLFMALTIPMTASVENADDMGLAAGILVSFRLFGALLGLAVSSAIFEAVFSQHIVNLGSLPSEIASLLDSSNAIGYIPELRSANISTEVLDGVLEAYRGALMAVFLALVGISALGLLAAVFIPELTLEREEMGRQRLEDTS